MSSGITDCVIKKQNVSIRPVHIKIYFHLDHNKYNEFEAMGEGVETDMEIMNISIRKLIFIDLNLRKRVTKATETQKNITSPKNGKVYPKNMAVT